MKRLIYIALLLLALPAKAQTVVVGNSPFDFTGGGGGWVPTDETGLAVWLDAAGTFYSDTGCSSSTTSGEINCWENGGTSADFTHTVGPDYTTIGGGGAGTFDGSEYLAIGTDVSSSEITVVWAQVIDSFTDNNQAPWGGGDDTGRLRNVSSTAWRIVSNDGSGSDIAVTAMSTATAYVLTMTYDVNDTGNEVKFYINGSLEDTVSMLSEVIDIGRYGKPNTQNGIPGKQGTFLVYTEVLGSTALCNAMTYVGDQHSITVTCP